MIWKSEVNNFCLHIIVLMSTEWTSSSFHFQPLYVTGCGPVGSSTVPTFTTINQVWCNKQFLPHIMTGTSRHFYTLEFWGSGFQQIMSENNSRKRSRKTKLHTLLTSCCFLFSIDFLSNRPLAHVCIDTLIISFTPIRCNDISLHWWMGQISAFAYVDYNLFRNNYALTLGKYCSMKFRCNKHFSFID